MQFFAVDSVESIVSALVLDFLLGLLAFRARSISKGGLLAGWGIGGAIAFGYGLPGFLTLAFFFVAGTVATKHGYAKKQAMGVAQESEGVRSAAHAFANGGAPALIALASLAMPRSSWLAAAYVAAIATACGDTVSSELGQLYGRNPFLPTSFRRVPPGTEGAVSVEGTLAGIVACTATAVFAWLCGLLPVRAILPAAIGGVLGGAFESYLGAMLGKKRMLNNELMNALNTVAGAAAGAGIFLLFG